MSDYVKIKSISIDMSTEESPYNRIYAKPIEKQGDVLLCDFESANYDIEQKALKEENTKLKTENKWYSEQLNEAVKEVGQLKELLTMVKPVLQLEYNVTENRNLIKKINQVLGEE